MFCFLFIKLFTKKGDVVLDPFIGSGTTALAAMSLNRNFIGIEKNKRYYKIAHERIKAIGRESKKQSLRKTIKIKKDSKQKILF